MKVCARKRDSSKIWPWVVMVFLFMTTTWVSGTSVAVTSKVFTSKNNNNHRQSSILNRRGGGGDAAIWEGLKNSMASALAAASSKTLLAPFDTIKTIQQQELNGAAPLSFLQAAKQICSRPGGFLELYAGLGVAVLGAMPSVALYFGVYSYTKSKLFNTFSPETGWKKSVCIMASAAWGNTVASFSRVPFEVMKQKLQTGEYKSTMDALSHMKNMKAFFPTGSIYIQMIRDIPYAMMTLLCYEYLREHWVRNSDSPWKDMVAGAIAGGFGSYVTNPMDVVKTRLQTSNDLYGGNIWKCTLATYQEGGSMAFLRGSVPRLLHKIPANGCFFVFYELFRRILHASPK